MNNTCKKNEFSTDYYAEVNRARESVFQSILPDLIRQQDLKTAVDAGCGIGYYSSYLTGLGLDVIGIDGRAENIEIAHSNLPNINFQVANIEDHLPENVGQADLVFCAGVLYHLENPFRAIRNLRKMCKRACVIETRVHWSDTATALFVRDGDGASQALNQYAMILTRRCIVNMLYAAGFENVYSIKYKSDHEELKEDFLRRPRRHFWIASFGPLDMAELRLEPRVLPEDMTSFTPYLRSFGQFYRSVIESFRWLLNS